MTQRLTRRRVLRGAGKIAIALPFLESFAPRVGEAHELGFPKRLVVMYSGGCGTVYSQWQPVGSGSEFTLSPILEPLASHQSDLVVLSGINNESCNHQAADFHTRGFVHMLTSQDLIPVPELNNGFGDRGYAGGPSVDQEVAKHVGGDTRFASLELGVMSEYFWGAHPNSRMSYVAANEPAPAEDNPVAAFDRIFSDFDVDPIHLEKIRAERRSVLDFVLEDFANVKRDVSKADGRRLEAHMDRIREIEAGLDFENGACSVPGTVAGVDPYDNNAYPNIGRAQADLIVAALACDLTRVASLQWAHGQSEVHHAWLGGTAGSTHHGISHRLDADSLAALVSINRWYAGELAYMIDRMKEIPEGDGTLFDHTLIVWANEMGEGQAHNYNNTPWVLAGPCCGAVATGQHLVYGGEPHGRVLVSILNAMGVEAQTFGKPEFSNGPLADVLT